MGGSWAECCSVGVIAAAAVSLTAGSVSEMIRHSQTESVELTMTYQWSQVPHHVLL